MYIQRCVKGIVGEVPGKDGITKADAHVMAVQGGGIISNWWRKTGLINPSMVEDVLTEANLDRHLHDYDAFGSDTPFISLACGAVERDALVQQNFVYSARDTALMFATEDWTRPGAVLRVGSGQLSSRRRDRRGCGTSAGSQYLSAVVPLSARRRNHREGEYPGQPDRTRRMVGWQFQPYRP